MERFILVIELIIFIFFLFSGNLYCDFIWWETIEKKVENLKIPQTVINIKMTINSRNKLGKATKKNNEKILRLIDIENRKKKNCTKRNFIKAKKR